VAKGISAAGRLAGVGPLRQNTEFSQIFIWRNRLISMGYRQKNLEIKNLGDRPGVRKTSTSDQEQSYQKFHFSESTCSRRKMLAR
jgi:hypothetical protein